MWNLFHLTFPYATAGMPIPGYGNVENSLSHSSMLRQHGNSTGFEVSPDLYHSNPNLVASDRNQPGNSMLPPSNSFSGHGMQGFGGNASFYNPSTSVRQAMNYYSHQGVPMNQAMGSMEAMRQGRIPHNSYRSTGELEIFLV